MASLDLPVLPGGDGQRQPSQSSRIVQVPRNASQDQQVGLVITKIEDVFEAMVDNLAHNGNALCIPYRSRKASPDQPARMLRFPGTTAQEATKFSKHSPPPSTACAEHRPDRNRTGSSNDPHHGVVSRGVGVRPPHHQEVSVFAPLTAWEHQPLTDMQKHLLPEPRSLHKASRRRPAGRRPRLYPGSWQECPQYSEHVCRQRLGSLADRDRSPLPKACSPVRLDSSVKTGHTCATLNTPRTAT